jgi:hypothetical protein
LRWIQKRRKELLPIPYAHVVFTVPHLLAPLALQNKKLVYTLLLRLSAETLVEVARNPKYLGAEIGFFSVLHTWTQKMEFHPHVHCVVPAGGLSFDHQRWVGVNPRYRFFLPQKVLGLVFRAKLAEALRRLARAKSVSIANWALDPKAFHLRPGTVPLPMGRSLQTTLRRPGICSPLSRPLHPSSGHFQPPSGFLCQRRGHLPLARPRPRQPGTTHDTQGR